MQGDMRYHGYHHGTSGVGMIAVEDAEGNTLGVVHHVVVDSPTGLSWGFVGSGPADTARSVLLAALDEDARCQTCHGTGYLTADNADTIRRSAASTARTACTDCDRGYRHVPYRLFTTDHVAHWGEQWCMTRQQVLDWLAAHHHG